MVTLIVVNMIYSNDDEAWATNQGRECYLLQYN